MKAKDTSHIGMIVGAISLIIVFAIVLVKYIISGTYPSIDGVKALILIGIAPSIPFSPVYISTWLDKFIELKNGKKTEPEINVDDEIEKEILM